MELLKSPKSMFDEAYILLDLDKNDATIIEKILKKIIGSDYELSHFRENWYILKLMHSVKNLPVFKASFSAMAVDEAGLKRALLLPCNNPSLYSYINKVDDKKYEDFYSLAKKYPEIYDETMFLILGLKKSLLYTLKVYIENNCSSRTAQIELFLHYNTVDYRIKKCSEVLGMNFDLFPTRAYLYEMLDKIDCSQEDL